MGLGIVDGALFDLCYERIKQRQAEGKPFFLTTLTLSTHHPFAAPQNHPEVRLLQEQVSGQVCRRSCDIRITNWSGCFPNSFARDSCGIRSSSCLGDHGRHEPVGSSDIERKAGHFASPLFIWMDESLRTPATYRPRTVSTIASQVDVAPTLLALNGAFCLPWGRLPGVT
jgi:phosphoglycerol transferase MdoB-like AlkP superfamily enzyme